MASQGPSSQVLTVCHSNSDSCINIYVHSCMTHNCQMNEIHVQIMRFTCCLNMSCLPDIKEESVMVRTTGNHFADTYFGSRNRIAQQ